MTNPHEISTETIPHEISNEQCFNIQKNKKLSKVVFVVRVVFVVFKISSEDLSCRCR